MNTQLWNRLAHSRGATCTSLVLALVFAAGSTCGVTTGNPNGDPNLVGTPGSNNNGGNGTASGVKPTITSSDHVIGAADAAVTVVEYSDFQCPFCGKFERESFPTLKTQYIDTGKVRWVFRHFPLRTIHNRAEAAARATECAGDQVDFFAYKDEIFADQSDLSDARLSTEAVALGANKAQFDACATGSSKAARVQQDVTSGTSLGVSSTPTFIVDGEKFSGFKTAAEFGAILDNKLGN
jgi:protein-disulfide isomerase